MIVKFKPTGHAFTKLATALAGAEGEVDICETRDGVDYYNVLFDGNYVCGVPASCFVEV